MRRPLNKQPIEAQDIDPAMMDEAIEQARQVVADNIHLPFDQVLGTIWIRGAVQGGIVAMQSEACRAVVLPAREAK